VLGLPGEQDDDDDDADDNMPVWPTWAVGAPSSRVRDELTSIMYIFTGEQGRAPREQCEAEECD
jgi:hypothetical protein